MYVWNIHKHTLLSIYQHTFLALSLSLCLSVSLCVQPKSSLTVIQSAFLETLTLLYSSEIILMQAFPNPIYTPQKIFGVRSHLSVMHCCRANQSLATSNLYKCTISPFDYWSAYPAISHLHLILLYQLQQRIHGICLNGIRNQRKNACNFACLSVVPQALALGLAKWWCSSIKQILKIWEKSKLWILAIAS